MKTFLLKLFTWWNSQTFGTQFWTWMYGEFVGEDEFGNRYHRTSGGKVDKTLGFERRWGVYNGYTEASAVPPSWHGWLHHTVDTPPTQENYKPYPWQKPHRPNLTGNPGAYRAPPPPDPPANPENLQPIPRAEAAPPEFDGYAGGIPPPRVDARRRPPAQG